MLAGAAGVGRLFRSKPFSRDRNVTMLPDVRYVHPASRNPSSRKPSSGTPNPAAATRSVRTAGRGGGPNCGHRKSRCPWGEAPTNDLRVGRRGRVFSHPNPTAHLVGVTERHSRDREHHHTRPSRAARRPSTPLTELASVASDQLGTVGRADRRRRSLVGPRGLDDGRAGHGRAPSDDTVTGALAAVDTDALTASAKAVLASAPVVSAPADAEVDDRRARRQGRQAGRQEGRGRPRDAAPAASAASLRDTAPTTEHATRRQHR